MSHAVVLSGGGVRGAFQVGALSQLLGRVDATAVDAFFGTSTGALTAALMAQAPDLAGQLSEVANLQRIYRGITGNRDLYSGWNFLPAVIARFLFGKAAFDPAGLRRLLRENLLSNGSQLAGSRTAFGCAVTCLETGDAMIVTNQPPPGGLLDFARQPARSLPDFVLASASFPLAFPAVEIAGDHYVDGGVRVQTPLRAAVHWLKTQGAGPHRLTVLLTSPTAIAPSTATRGVAGAKRVLDLIETTLYLDDLSSLRARNRTPQPGDVAIDHLVVTPTVDYGSALTFDPANIARMLADGAALATAAEWVT